MPRQLILIALTLVAGIAIGVYVTHDDGETAAPTAADSSRGIDSSEGTGAAAPANRLSADADIVELRRRFEDEIRARRALERRLFELGREVEALQRAAAAAPAGSPTAAAIDGDAPNEVDERREAGWFDTQALVDSGMDAALAEELQVFYEQVEMERLYLRDQSLREDWDRDEYRTALDEIEDREAELRQRLGEDGYDAYLYASGQPNRVSVTSVIASAPAGQAGIEAGDHILRYDDQRIYNWFELREATAGGEVGDTVAVEVDRGGQTLQFYLVRGPLGIRMNTLSVAPE